MAPVGLDRHGCLVNPNHAVTVGAAAQAGLERRRATHVERPGRAWLPVVGRGLVGVVVGLTLMLVAPAWWLFGLALACTAILGAIVTLLLHPDHGRPWVARTEGERQTAEILARLESDGYRVLHGRRLPGTQAIIDHIVVGPTGVFVVETRTWAGAVRVRNGAIRVAGRRAEVIDRVAREADAVAVALPGTQVMPVVCVHRADLPLHQLDVDGVRVVGPTGLFRRLREGPARLGIADIERLTGQLEERLIPAS